MNLNQAACGDTDQWTYIDAELDEDQFKKQQKRIIEKLDDDDNYAAIHHAVLRNNLRLCQKLIAVYKCSKNLPMIYFYHWFCLSDVDLIGWGGMTALHLAARSTKIDKDTELARDDFCSAKQLSKDQFYKAKDVSKDRFDNK